MADTEDNTITIDRLSLLKNRLKLAEGFSKKPHKEWERLAKEYEIEDVSDVGEIRTKVKVGKIFRSTESDIPAIFDDQPELFIKGSGQSKILDDPLNNGYDWLWDIQGLEDKIEDTAVYFDLFGMGFMDTPWLTKTKKVKDTEVTQEPAIDPATGQVMLDETGQPVMQQVSQEVEYETYVKHQPNAGVVNPFKVHFSPETIFNRVLDYEHCPYYIREHTVSPEEIKSRFGKTVEATETLNTNITDIDTEIAEFKTDSEKQDIKRVTMYEYYGVLPEKQARDIEASEPWRYDKDYHIYFTKNEELKVEECPYTVKPLRVLGNYGLANKFWKFGDARAQLPLVQEYEQYRSLVLAHTRKMVNPKVMVDTNSQFDEQAFKNPNPGVVVKYQGQPNAKEPYYLNPPQLGGEVGNGIEMVSRDLESTSGQFNLAQGGGSSTVKTPRGIATYAEAADKNSRRKKKKVARFIRDLIVFQFEQCGMNWDAEDPRVAEILFADQQVDPNQVAQVLALMKDPNMLAKIDIEVESLSINRVQIKQDALDLFDLSAKYPNIFNTMEMAKDLLQNGYNKKDADRYLFSMEDQEAQTIQKFIQQLAQTNPELAAQVAQNVQMPNASAMQGDQAQAAATTAPSKEQLAPEGDLGSLGPVG